MKIALSSFGLVLGGLAMFLLASPAMAIDITSLVVVEILPLPPSNLSATANAYNQVGLSWTDNSSNETGFAVERKTGLAGSYAEITRTAANVASYIDNGVSENTTYYYQVRAFLNNGYSAYGAEASTTTPSAPLTPPPSPPPSSGGGGGGGGGGPSPSISGATVVFRGKAYPSSNITLLKDAQVAAIGVAGEDANFEFTLSGLTPGTYNFGVWAEDYKGNRSITLQFQISVTANASMVVSGIFIAPTISVDKIEVVQGEPLNILGQSAPSSTISVFIGSAQQLVKKTGSDSSGAWLYKFDTSEVDMGDHGARATAAKSGDISTFSQTVAFKVGTRTVYASTKKCPIKGDFNGDCRVNLVDFSMLAYWYKRPLTKAAALRFDLNGDGKVDLIDFSIVAYYWTG